MGAPAEPDLFLQRFDARRQYQEFVETHADLLAAQAKTEAALLEGQGTEAALLEGQGEEFVAPGWCYVCDRPSTFLVDYNHAPPSSDPLRVPNWRERLVCPHCGLNNRMRATIHMIEKIGRLGQRSTIYAAEQTTPMYACLASRFAACVGSECLDDGTPRGMTNGRGIRHEDLTALSFPTATFDAVVSLDVFEHVPDFPAAFAECHRVLAPGGKLFVTVPFRIDLQANLVRARRAADGEIEHLLEPEYHGDPLSDQGCLAYYHFGWQILEQLREAGFDTASAYAYWSRGFGYLGAAQTLFVAEKAAA